MNANLKIKLAKVKGRHVLRSLLALLIFYGGVNIWLPIFFNSRNISAGWPLDLQINYNTQSVYKIINNLSPAGRQIIKYVYLADFISPLLYSATLALAILWLINILKSPLPTLFLGRAESSLRSLSSTLGIASLLPVAPRPLIKGKGNWFWLASVPFAAAIFDWIENIFIIKMFSDPYGISSLAPIANIMTLLKFSFLILSGATILILALLVLIKKSRREPGTTTPPSPSPS